LPVDEVRVARNGNRMNTSSDQRSVNTGSDSIRPFRRAVLRGLGVVMPPLLTIVLFIWAWTTIDSYVLQPIENAVAEVMVFAGMQSHVKDGIPADVVAENIRVVDKHNQRVPTAEVLHQVRSVQGIVTSAPLHGWRVVSFTYEGTTYVPVAGNRWVPNYVYDTVAKSPGSLVLPSATARDVYEQYIRVRYLPRWRVIPVFLVMFIGLLYLLGKFLAAGVGRMLLATFEGIIRRLPLVRNVYSSVKQVTDFVFSEREIEYTRVVAVQYPREGIWSIGFVTGESMLDIQSAANEPVLSVLMPTSPMPATGFTVTVRKSETIDLDITIDQAIQFVVSCGVVVPPHQQPPASHDELSASIAERLQMDTQTLEAPKVSDSSSGGSVPPVLSAPSDNGQQGTDSHQPPVPASEKKTELDE